MGASLLALAKSIYCLIRIPNHKILTKYSVITVLEKLGQSCENTCES